MKWSKDEEALLIELWPSRANQAEIAKRFPGRTRAQVKNKAQFMGLTVRDLPPRCPVRTPERIVLARQMRDSGRGYYAIAITFGLSSGSTIRQWLDAGYAERCRQAARARRASIPKSPVTARSAKTIDQDALQLAKQIPPDTRDTTARLCGDPLPGRRAIDFKREMQPRQDEVPFQ